jgi:SHS2 domain-containing protein
MSRKPYEVSEHTADIGLHIYGETLPVLFRHAAMGMESLLVPLEQVQPLIQREITVTGHDHLSLLIAWLNELIFLFDTEYLLFREIEITTLTETTVTGKAYGEPYDSQRHELSSAIKAATWHDAAVTQDETGYRATVIFDL